MPELPEVESLRLGLVKHIIGSKILKVEVKNEKLIAGKGTTRKADKNKTKEFVEELKGKKIVEIDRRAKNLIIKLEDKNKDKNPIILVHLKMTGQLVFEGKERTLGGHPIQESEGKLPHKHTYIIFHLDNGTLYYNDVRQFGYVLYIPHLVSPYQGKGQNIEHFKDLGMEPFSENFTEKYFRDEIKKYNSPIKKVLLDQKIVVGCGNIYCDEVLWHSSVLPSRICKTLTDTEIKNTYKYIKEILENAINAGGSSIANYLLADGSKGNYAHSHKAYKKENTKCTFPKCKGIIEKINFAGRGTHFCNVHQR
jgi:formamidopyrimidine-DNA glycosylase